MVVEAAVVVFLRVVVVNVLVEAAVVVFLGVLEGIVEV